MNLAFNEISFLPLTDNEHTVKERFLGMVNTFKVAKEKYGFSHIIFSLDLAETKVTVDKTFYQWAHSIDHQGEKNKILSLIKQPFINDILKGQIGYLDHYYFENSDLGIEQTYCIGLSTAHIIETAAISLAQVPFWEQIQINFYKERLQNQDEADTINEPEAVSVYNISTENSINHPLFATFAETIARVELIETSLLPINKPIHFRDDHGTNILMAFAKRLINSPYVTEVINSIAFNSQTVRFIRSVFPDGKIEIVLHWEDKGYGMVIQTTGRNLRETKAISKILQSKYDK